MSVYVCVCVCVFTCYICLLALDFGVNVIRWNVEKFMFFIVVPMKRCILNDIYLKCMNLLTYLLHGAESFLRS